MAKAVGEINGRKVTARELADLGVVLAELNTDDRDLVVEKGLMMIPAIKVFSPSTCVEGIALIARAHARGIRSWEAYAENQWGSAFLSWASREKRFRQRNGKRRLAFMCPTCKHHHPTVVMSDNPLAEANRLEWSWTQFQERYGSIIRWPAWPIQEKKAKRQAKA